MSWERRHFHPFFCDLAGLIPLICSYVASSITRFWKTSLISASGVSLNRCVFLQMSARLRWATKWHRSKSDLIFLRIVSIEKRKHNFLSVLGSFFPSQPSSIAIKQIYCWHVWLFQQNREGAMDQHSHLISHYIPPEPTTSPAMHWGMAPDKESNVQNRDIPFLVLSQVRA